MLMHFVLPSRIERGLFAGEVLRNNPPLPDLPYHALPVLNKDRTDHNTKPMEHSCIATVAWSSYYYMT